MMSSHVRTYQATEESLSCNRKDENWSDYHSYSKWDHVNNNNLLGHQRVISYYLNITDN